MKMMVGDKDPGVVAHVLQFLLIVAEVCVSLFILFSGPFSQQIKYQYRSVSHYRQSCPFLEGT
jgi:hypothetical protein